METLSTAIGWTALVLGTLAILTGIAVAVIHKREEKPAIAAVPGNQGAIGDTFKNGAELAKALKDLDSSGRLLTIGLVLIGIASVVAGLDNVADAIASTAK